MALREKLDKRVAPFLEPDEEVEVVFIALAGPNPWLAAIFGLLPMLIFGLSSYVTIVTTERANVVLCNAWMSSLRPTGVLFRGPRESLGEPSGIWAEISAGGERYWVHRRFHSDVRLAEDLLADSDAPPAPQPQ